MRFIRLCALAALFLACASSGPPPPSFPSRQVSDDRAPPEPPVVSPEVELMRMQKQQFQDAIRNQPSNADLYYKMGLVELRLGEWSSARKSFEKALDLKPILADAMYQIGLSWENEGEMYVVGEGRTILVEQRNKAIKAYQKAVEINQKHNEAYYRLALMSLLKTDLELALWASVRLSELEPDTERSLVLLKQVYKKMKDKETR